MTILPIGDRALIETKGDRQLDLSDAQIGSKFFDVDLVFHKAIMNNS